MQLCHCEMASIVVSLENLQTFPWVQERILQDKLKLHGWYFDIVSGDMQYYDAERLQFAMLA